MLKHLFTSKLTVIIKKKTSSVFIVILSFIAAFIRLTESQHHTKAENKPSVFEHIPSPFHFVPLSPSVRCFYLLCYYFYDGVVLLRLIFHPACIKHRYRFLVRGAGLVDHTLLFFCYYSVVLVGNSYRPGGPDS